MKIEGMSDELIRRLFLARDQGYPWACFMCGHGLPEYRAKHNCEPPEGELELRCQARGSDRRDVGRGE